MARYYTPIGRLFRPESESREEYAPARDCEVAFSPAVGALSVTFSVDGEVRELEVPICPTGKWNELVASLPQWDIETNGTDNDSTDDGPEPVRYEEAKDALSGMLPVLTDEEASATISILEEMNAISVE